MDLELRARSCFSITFLASGSRFLMIMPEAVEEDVLLREGKV